MEVPTRVNTIDCKIKQEIYGRIYSQKRNTGSCSIFFFITFFHQVNHIKFSFHLLWFAVLLIMEYFKILRLLQAKGFEFTTYMHMLGTQ